MAAERTNLHQEEKTDQRDPSNKEVSWGDEKGIPHCFKHGKNDGISTLLKGSLDGSSSFQEHREGAEGMPESDRARTQGA